MVWGALIRKIFKNGDAIALNLALSIFLLGKVSEINEVVQELIPTCRLINHHDIGRLLAILQKFLLLLPHLKYSALTLAYEVSSIKWIIIHLSLLTIRTYHGLSQGIFRLRWLYVKQLTVWEESITQFAGIWKNENWCLSPNTAHQPWSEVTCSKGPYGWKTI